MQSLYPTVNRNIPGLNTIRPFISTPSVDRPCPLCPELSTQIVHNRQLDQILSELKNLSTAINELKYQVQQLKLQFGESRVCVCSQEPKTVNRFKYPLEMMPTSVLPSVFLGSSSTVFHDPISSIVSLLSDISFDSELTWIEMIKCFLISSRAQRAECLCSGLISSAIGCNTRNEENVSAESNGRWNCTKKMISIGWLLFVVFQLVDGKTIPQPFYNSKQVWTGPIVLGTPSQFNQMRLDTESDAFFFISKYCKTTGCTANRKGFDTKKSKTFRQMFNFPYAVDYLGAKQTGHLMSEALTGLGKPIHLVFPLVDRPQGDLVQSVGDGVAGLGFPRGVSLLPNFALVTKLLGEQMYTFHVDSFNYTKSSGLQNSGFGTYAGNDDKNCKSDIVWHPIAVQKRWILKLDKVTFGGKNYAGANALIKPGPFKIHGPKSDIETILKTLNAKQENGEYVVDCNGRSAFPNFEFTVQGITHKLSPTQYTVQSLNDKSKCIALFQEVDKKLGDQPWILGDPLFHKSCVSLHIGKSKIGFAALK